jgi:hypothetical protein
MTSRVRDRRRPRHAFRGSPPDGEPRSPECPCPVGPRNWGQSSAAARAAQALATMPNNNTSFRKIMDAQHARQAPSRHQFSGSCSRQNTIASAALRSAPSCGVARLIVSSSDGAPASQHFRHFFRGARRRRRMRQASRRLRRERSPRASPPDFHGGRARRRRGRCAHPERRIRDCRRRGQRPTRARHGRRFRSVPRRRSPGPAVAIVSAAASCPSRSSWAAPRRGESRAYVSGGAWEPAAPAEGPCISAETPCWAGATSLPRPK